MQEKIFNILVEQNEITWKDIIYDLINKEKMDPWDLNISLLTQKYIEVVRGLKEHDFKISGKVLLAAAILLKIKAKRLVGGDMDEFDRLLSSAEISEEEFYDELEGELRKPFEIPDEEKLRLIPRTPQPRKRKVSIHDLVGALEKALEVKRRRVMNSIPELRVEVPEKKTDVTLSIKRLYSRILDFFVAKKGNRLTFSHIVPSDKKEDKIAAFVPLLHLTNQRKVDLEQEHHFGEINISLARRSH